MFYKIKLSFFFIKIIIKYFLLYKKKPVDFDGELKIGDVRYNNIT